MIRILYIRGINEIIGYDCGSSNFNTTTVSLLDVKECDIPLIGPQVQKIIIQLLNYQNLNQLMSFNAKFLFHELYIIVECTLIY